MQKVHNKNPLLSCKIAFKYRFFNPHYFTVFEIVVKIKVISNLILFKAFSVAETELHRY